MDALLLTEIYRSLFNIIFKALHALLYWAALTYNTKLVKILWCKISEPMTMALVMSTLHSRLASDWISDHDLQLKTKQIGM